MSDHGYDPFVDDEALTRDRDMTPEPYIHMTEGFMYSPYTHKLYVSVSDGIGPSARLWNITNQLSWVSNRLRDFWEMYPELQGCQLLVDFVTPDKGV